MNKNIIRFSSTIFLIETFFVPFSVLPVVSLGLKITRFEVPSLVVPGDSAILTCFYDLGKEKLYSVKWYKDQVEFFRFFPSLSPQYMAFPAPGLNIDVSFSS
ncbi:uncharacterized protein TNCT_274731 [Trichonephila clavata]|uniref:Ig-like domain-containing protein n=1 Tax=Trichonephila clavata TaxID=2740835 RepID=A0A8X6M296_TRICU|nr:uncharacterized protein TNCT_274731 [Trichonephila clavata]